MSLQLILGNAGSGKTGYINRTLIKEAMESPGKQFIALVPEQFTMEAQKALVELHPGRCVLNIDILSFERLAYRVFEELSFDPGTVLVSLMSQYLPWGRVPEEFPELNRRLRKGEARTVRAYMENLGLEGFTQEMDSAQSQYIPPFDLTGVEETGG